MFQVKSFSTILLGMINRAKAVQSKITDFRVGSVARTLFESPAAEIDELYQQMFIGLKEAIPVAIYDSFSFERIAAQPSTGTVRVSIASTTSDTIIGAGSVFKASGYSGSFATLNDATILAGNTFADCYVSATVAGSIGNVVSGSTFSVNPSVSGMSSAVAVANFTSGSDEETDSQRKTRFAAYILTLNRGTTAALRYGLSLAAATDAAGNVLERAIYTQIIEPWVLDSGQPVGLVNCYIHNGASGASSALITDAQKRLDGYVDANGSRVSGWKSAGVKVTVQAAENVLVPVTATVSVSGDYASTTVIDQVQSAIGNYISTLDIGEDVLCSEIIAAAMGIEGVVNFSLTLPATDVVIANTQKPAVGAYTLSAA